VNCDDQQELDCYWDRLLDGGTPQQCGWLKDRYGLSWQVVSRAAIEMLTSADRVRSQRVMQALMQMVKLGVTQLRRAYEYE
jgi:predicted 3-demethylubiquinone-9 3-methyltransferase (glyoxalase superfamily)